MKAKKVSKLETLEKYWDTRHNVSTMPNYDSVVDPLCPLTQAKKFSDFQARTVSAARVGHSRAGKRRITSRELEPLAKVHTAPLQRIEHQRITYLPDRPFTDQPFAKKTLQAHPLDFNPSMSKSLNSLWAPQSDKSEAFNGSITVSLDNTNSGDLDIVRKILQREHLVECAKTMTSPSTPEDNSDDWNLKLEPVLMSLRAISMQIVEDIAMWKLRKGKQSEFMFNSENYLLKMQDDLSELDEHEAVSNWLGFSLAQNPLIVPAPYRGQQKKQTVVPENLIMSAGIDALRIRDCEKVIQAEVERFGNHTSSLIYPQISVHTADGSNQWRTLEPANQTHPAESLAGETASQFDDFFVEGAEVGDSATFPATMEGTASFVSRRSLVSQQQREYLAKTNKQTSLAKKLSEKIQKMSNDMETAKDKVYQLTKELASATEVHRDLKQKASEVKDAISKSSQSTSILRSFSHLTVQLTNWEKEIAEREKQLKERRTQLFFEKLELDRKEKLVQSTVRKLEEEREKVKQRAEARAQLQAQKEAEAVLNIQRIARGFLARIPVWRRKELWDEAAIKIQHWFKRWLEHQMLKDTHTSINNHFRRKRGLNARARASRVIQTYVRRYLARKEFKRRLKERRRLEGKRTDSMCSATSESISSDIKAREQERAVWDTIDSQSIYYYINAANLNLTDGTIIKNEDAVTHMDAAEYNLQKHLSMKSSTATFAMRLPDWIQDENKEGLAGTQSFLYLSAPPQPLDSPHDSETMSGTAEQISLLDLEELDSLAALSLETKQETQSDIDVDEMAKKIQAVMRGAAERKSFKKQKEVKTGAVVKIQSFYRGSCVRMNQPKNPLKPFKDLTVEEAASWVCSVGLRMYEKNIVEHHIDGAALFIANHDTLKEIGITLRMHRVRLLHEIEVSKHAMFASRIITNPLPSAERKDDQNQSQKASEPKGSFSTSTPNNFDCTFLVEDPGLGDQSFGIAKDQSNSNTIIIDEKSAQDLNTMRNEQQFLEAQLKELRCLLEGHHVPEPQQQCTKIGLNSEIDFLSSTQQTIAEMLQRQQQFMEMINQLKKIVKTEAISQNQGGGENKSN